MVGIGPSCELLCLDNVMQNGIKWTLIQVSALLTGVHRAFPFANIDSEMMTAQIETRLHAAFPGEIETALLKIPKFNLVDVHFLISSIFVSDYCMWTFQSHILI